MKGRAFRLNAGTGMALGVFGAAVIAIAVNLITGEAIVWAWAIPVGIAVGLALGAGAARRSREE